MATTTKNERVINTYENAIIQSINTAEAYGGSSRRLDIFIDKEIECFDKEGKQVTRNNFSVDYTKLCDAINVPLFKMLVIKAMGRQIKPEIFALMLYNAEISFTRTLYKKGESRENRPFEKDTFVTDVTNITLHIVPEFKQEIQRMITSNECYVTKQNSNVSVNFFNV